MQCFFGKARSGVSRRHERRASPENAETRVIGTPELLEAILSYLPARDLIVTMRVSSTFRNLIHSSPTLLRNLFLLPRKEPFETTSLVVLDETTWPWNPPTNITKEYKVVTLCPLLDMSWNEDETIEERSDYKDHEIVSVNQCARKAHMFSHMYLTSPPCVEVDIDFVYSNTDPRLRTPKTEFQISARRTIRREMGVTFDALAEATYPKGYVQVTEVRKDRKFDESRGETVEVEDTSLQEQIKAWEEKHSGMMLLDDVLTKIRLHGVIVREEMEFEESWRRISKKMMLELKHRVTKGVEQILRSPRARTTR